MTDKPHRIVFTHATAKAMRGIINLFGTIHIRPSSDGRFTVVAERTPRL